MEENKKVSAQSKKRVRKIKNMNGGTKRARIITMVASVVIGIALWAIFAPLSKGNIFAGPQDVFGVALPRTYGCRWR